MIKLQQKNQKINFVLTQLLEQNSNFKANEQTQANQIYGISIQGSLATRQITKDFCQDTKKEVFLANTSSRKLRPKEWVKELSNFL